MQLVDMTGMPLSGKIHNSGWQRVILRYMIQVFNF